MTSDSPGPPSAAIAPWLSVQRGTEAVEGREHVILGGQVNHCVEDGGAVSWTDRKFFLTKSYSNRALKHLNLLSCLLVFGPGNTGPGHSWLSSFLSASLLDLAVETHSLALCTSGYSVRFYPNRS